MSIGELPDCKNLNWKLLVYPEFDSKYPGYGKLSGIYKKKEPL